VLVGGTVEAALNAALPLVRSKQLYASILASHAPTCVASKLHSQELLHSGHMQHLKCCSRDLSEVMRFPRVCRQPSGE